MFVKLSSKYVIAEYNTSATNKTNMLPDIVCVITGEYIYRVGQSFFLELHCNKQPKMPCVALSF